jgi:hypothetical protein
MGIFDNMRASFNEIVHEENHWNGRTQSSVSRTPEQLQHELRRQVESALPPVDPTGGVAESTKSKASTEPPIRLKGVIRESITDRAQNDLTSMYSK